MQVGSRNRSRRPPSRPPQRKWRTACTHAHPHATVNTLSLPILSSGLPATVLLLCVLCVCPPLLQFLDLNARPGLLRTILEAQETRGLTRSDDISRLLPGEAALLARGRQVRNGVPRRGFGQGRQVPRCGLGQGIFGSVVEMEWRKQGTALDGPGGGAR